MKINNQMQNEFDQLKKGKYKPSPGKSSYGLIFHILFNFFMSLNLSFEF